MVGKQITLAVTAIHRITCTLPLIPAIYYYHLIYIIHRVYAGFPCTQNGKS